MENIALSVRNLKKFYPIRDQRSFFKYDMLKAVDDISFDLYDGETLSIVGESGCGKSTTRKLLVRTEEPTDGQIIYDGMNVSQMNPSELKSFRRNIQVIFQDPYSSLNPKWRVFDLIVEPLVIHGIGNKKTRTDKVYELMNLVGLNKSYANRYPHEFSGGQRQRICIARALAIEPHIIVADEPVSALDVSIQAQVINLLIDLKNKLNLTYVFISHDLNIVRHISDRVAVMYLGKIIEIALTKDLYDEPAHPYTKALINSIPIPNPDKIMETNTIKGEVPSPINPPSGCYFHPRCEYAKAICKEVRPELREIGSLHQVACHLYE